MARRGGGLPIADATAIIRQVALGLSACHAKGITHRDVKPSNIMVGPRGRVALIDFGVCRVAGERTLTSGDGFVGTLHWAAPEQITAHDQVDARSDLYALGAVAYQLLTGRLAVRGATAQELMASVCNWTPPPPKALNPAIPDHLDRLCMRLLAKAPEQRPQSAEEVAHALDSPAHTPAGGFCGSCGRPLSSQSRFCSSCGARRLGALESAPRCFACGTEASEGASCPRCGRCFGPIEHRVTFVSGSLRGLTFRAPQGEYDVGRATLEPRDSFISRKQFRLSCANGALWLADLGGANATRVAGAPASHKTQLAPGVVISVAGNTGVYTRN